MDPGSYLAIIDMTAKVATLVFKTKQLWDEIKDVPADISDLLRELQLTGRLFDALRLQLERYSSSDMIWDERIMLDCLDSALTAQCSMDSLVVDLQKQLDSSRKGRRHLTAAKIVMRKDTLQKYKDRLYGSTRLLQCVASAESWNNGQAGSECTLPRTDTCVTFFYVSGDLIGNRQRNWDSEGKRIDQKRNSRPLRDVKTQEGEACSLYLQMPRWWSSKVWMFTNMRTTFGGGFQYRVYNILPGDSEVFERARQGDYRGVKQMLDDGDASCLDVTETGDSILHVALTHRRFDLCSLLIHQYRMHSFLEEQEHHFELQYGMALVMACVGIGENLAQPLPSEDAHKLAQLCKLYQFHQSAALLRTARMIALMLVKAFPTIEIPPCHNILDLEYGSLNLLHCFDAFNHAIVRGHRPVMAWKLIGAREPSSVADEAQVPDVVKPMLLHSAALAFGSRVIPHRLVKAGSGTSGSHEATMWIGDSTKEWRDFGQQLLAKSGNDIAYLCPVWALNIPTNIAMVEVIPWIGTPLTTLIGGVLYGRAHVERPRGSVHNSLHRALHEWLKALLEVQVDLVKYGDAETRRLAATKEAFDAHGLREIRPHPNDPFVSYKLFGDQHLSAVSVPIRVVNVLYGPEIRHWRIYFAPEYERMAGQFWNMIERRPSVMPGTWAD
ncbi:hypothetical protein LIA77_00974 [Sarocladium implicatum]|nr:hypothetical protein LIA77_00974 [Sarocladium implicatum]